MDLNKIPLFASLTRRMDWLNQRQRVLAQNIANADTPGYTAHDLKPLDFRDFLDGRRVQMAATDTKHIGFNKRQQGDFRSVKDKETYDKSPDKNTVVLEEQLIQVAESRMDYEMMTNLYKKHLGMLKLALRKPGG